MIRNLPELIKQTVAPQINALKTQLDQQVAQHGTKIDELSKRVDELSKKVDLATAAKPRKRLTFAQALQIVSIIAGLVQITSIVFHNWRRRSLPPPTPPIDYTRVNTDSK